MRQVRIGGTGKTAHTHSPTLTNYMSRQIKKTIRGVAGDHVKWQGPGSGSGSGPRSNNSNNNNKKAQHWH